MNFQFFTIKKELKGKILPLRFFFLGYIWEKITKLGHFIIIGNESYTQDVALYRHNFRPDFKDT